MHFFWGDKRYVPSDRPESNFPDGSPGPIIKVPVPVEMYTKSKQAQTAADVAEDYRGCWRVLRQERWDSTVDLHPAWDGAGWAHRHCFRDNALAETKRLVVQID